MGINHILTHTVLRNRQCLAAHTGQHSRILAEFEVCLMTALAQIYLPTEDFKVVPSTIVHAEEADDDQVDCVGHQAFIQNHRRQQRHDCIKRHHL